MTMLPRVRIRSQTIETKLVENLKGLDVLLAPRGYAAGGALPSSAETRHVFERGWKKTHATLPVITPFIGLGFISGI